MCRGCRRFTTEKTCPVCGSSDVSASWKGLVIIINPNESEIAKAIGIEAPGKYAIYVG